jgi:integrase/recombinase XerD
MRNAIPGKGWETKEEREKEKMPNEQMTDKEDLELYQERFRQHMQVLNCAQVTVTRYLRFLDHFIAFLKEWGVMSIFQVTQQHILDYQKEVFYHINKKGRQNLPQTQNNFLKTVKSFFHFLKAEGYLRYDPAKEVSYAKTPQTLPRTILTKAEIEKLLNVVDIHNPIGYRNRTILEVLYSTGIRRQELLNLKPQDIDYEKGFLRVIQGKGSRDRVVPLGKIAAKYLENYIKLVRIDLYQLKDSPYLFLSKRGNCLSAPALLQMINKYAKRVKLNKSVSPHVFRHTCATHLVQAKANIRCVQEILGHKSLDTTQKYTQITITDLKEAHSLCHPREKEKEENYY